MKDLFGFIDDLYDKADVSDNALSDILTDSYVLKESDQRSLSFSDVDTYLFKSADKKRREVYDTDVYARGLIEISNRCKNNCLYCGIRRGSPVYRYSLSQDEIMDCVRSGHEMGFRTFVLQGGENPGSDRMITELIRRIKSEFPDSAVTLSLGEKTKKIYEEFKQAGADRYLLRHETADKMHYEKLHPDEMSYDNRINCLWTLKELGYQVGAGFMVGSPYQTTGNLISDLRFLKELSPDMVGIGPFIPQHDTPFSGEKAGSLLTTLRCLALIRLMLPHALIPATTALWTIHPKGRDAGLKAGANVIMPNLTPSYARELYNLYDNKKNVKDEAGIRLAGISAKISESGYRLSMDRGDVIRK
ncbi:MAG: [FeFe] hydrogenase H-cluster radical SAM maturase HydE [Lachnospiraceae bacterium]|nr:[FeFe] hydrogenase H-cluster radical SAM maturase HydE [Lachnospiraceae bacterium]